MARDIPQEFRFAKDERFQSAPWIWLLEVDVPSEPIQTVRICNTNRAVLFDVDNTGTPREFLPFPFSFGDVKASTDSALPTLPIAISNVSRELLGTLINYRFLVKQKARLVLVNADTLDNPLARVDFILEVRAGQAEEQTITFNMSSYLLNNAQCPTRRLSRNFCTHEYGDALCGFDIDTVDPGMANLGLCVKTETACALRGAAEEAASLPALHPRRWGAQKGLPISGA